MASRKTWNFICTAESFSHELWSGKNVLAQIFFLYVINVKAEGKVNIRIHFIVLAKPAVNAHVCVQLPCVLLPIPICTELPFKLHRLPDGKDVIIL